MKAVRAARREQSSVSGKRIIRSQMRGLFRVSSLASVALPGRLQLYYGLTVTVTNSCRAPRPAGALRDGWVVEPVHASPHTTHCSMRNVSASRLLTAFIVCGNPTALARRRTPRRRASGTGPWTGLGGGRSRRRRRRWPVGSARRERDIIQLYDISTTYISRRRRWPVRAARSYSCTTYLKPKIYTAMPTLHKLLFSHHANLWACAAAPAAAPPAPRQQHT